MAMPSQGRKGGGAAGLVPGLPDAVVAHCILPRLPWYVRPCMRVISKAWRLVLDDEESACLLESRTKELYKPQGLFLIHELLRTSPGMPAHHEHDDDEEESEGGSATLPSARLSSHDSDDEPSEIFLLRKYAIEMCDVRDGSWHRLPPIPGYPSEIPSRCSFVCVDGKLYVMGGIPDSTKAKDSAEMHMLNVGLGHWWWEQCASMHFSRAYVKCAAQGEHIYVAGDTCPAEVYDVGADRWHRLPDMVDVQFFCNGMLALNHQIYAFGYDILDPDVVVEPDVYSAQVFHLLSGQWSTASFAFSKCCTSASGRLMLDLVDGALVVFDTSSCTSTTLHGTLLDVVGMSKGWRQETVRFFIENDYIHLTPCQVFDLVVLEVAQKPLQVYTLVSLHGSRLRTLWRGIVDLDACKVTWDQIITCRFRLCQLDSENLSEICCMSS
ncbi:F-box/kelch-repeat protein At1g16250 [Physcomitrium patens]|uniref:F-box domain-containing protein n=2 Tax=Physcomitrium patens TaxID=3218 RepID=A0A2K1JIA3_PHYPA|nr:F-box/kelch-repeat protein At1g16250-like [Physcomitrium patens]PNR41249.1 hypothetical protein PHYPA_018652 [Physcomitrium patens]|eukprot:XP_024394411.1 F-box/kelch-repeat protein At1g16250-like [Physcomitrella patens]